MAVYKEEKTNTWKVYYRYTDWQGKRKQTTKRGFATKREAQAWEREQLCKTQADLDMTFGSFVDCALPGFVDSKNEEKTERNAGYLVVSHSGGGMLRQGTRKGIRRTPANRGMRAHRIVKSLDISEDVCHGLCP